MASKVDFDDDIIADINIVPFVDIILVVLIIFMVTAPMINQQTLDLKLSKANSASKAPEAQVQIGISESGRILFNGRVTNENDVRYLVNELIQQKPSARAIISADKNVSHGLVVAVIDAVKAGGIDNFAIMVGKK